MQRAVRGLLRLSAPLAVLSFWSGIAMAVRAYPDHYQWAYQPLSILLYADRNPHGYLWAWAGIELCALAGFVWSVQLRQPRASANRAPGVWALRVGFFSMCFAVLPNKVLPLPKGHELLAVVAFLGICIGLVRLLFGAAVVGRLRAASLTAAELFGPLLAGLTQAYLAWAQPSLPWVTPAWRALGVPFYLSFAVWQWLTCAGFSICLLTLGADSVSRSGTLHDLQQQPGGVAYQNRPSS